VILGLVALALLVPAFIWLKDDPADVGARPRGAKEGEIHHVGRRIGA
jgi:hypothetical protein